MREHPGAANRTWLILLGLLALAGGIWILLLASGVADGASDGRAGRPQDRAAPGLGTFTEGSDWLPWAVLAAGVLLGLLALWWLLAQIPRRRLGREFRLQENPARGITVIDPAVLAGAFEEQAGQVPGVVGCDALLRGTAEEPDLALRLTVNSRADIQQVLREVQDRLVPDLAAALETPLHSLGILVEVSGQPAKAGTTVPASGTVVY
ncbi:hypothetical protein BN1051_02849 [Arthrobacter saudimassiliensis]|uniref:Alkaline shock response membrane anchor protein AmaP n=1 Tax=Arthrobacter saudimassiliensis TaxID=1461584 RepID=A0A078MT76_9MICC|nr:hypothetical protein BN1051_02849 [Arthrobacter saudimassiliensis]